MRELTPYDTGERLEPKPWPLRERSAYGKVDFDNDESATVATVWVESIDGAYHLMVDDHSGELVLPSGNMIPMGGTPSGAESIAEHVLDDPVHTMINWDVYSPNRAQVKDMILRAIMMATVTP